MQKGERDETPDLEQALLRIVVKKRIRDNGGWREIAAEFGLERDFWRLNQHPMQKKWRKSTEKNRQSKKKGPIETGPARLGYLPLGVVFLSEQESA